uniref:C1q domain-containing protein n=1 Tax=Oncorhynchus tshawytscha TaxID=74940 RepID=A0A8C8GBC3_ONCTS
MRSLQLAGQMTCASETTNEQMTTSPDIWTEMELRDGKLRNMEVRATASEAELMVTKNKVEKENADLTAGLSGSNISAFWDRETASEAENAAFIADLRILEVQYVIFPVFADRPKVAFSAGLTDSGTVGPFVAETRLVYTKVFKVLIPLLLSSDTGVFTAPVRGLYYISFTAMSVQTSFYFYACMYKNGQKIMYSQGYNAGGYETLSNGVRLELEEGDVVYMHIPASNRLYDNSNNHIFSGFLLFTV